MNITTKPKTRTEQILSVLSIVAWIAFIGYAMEAGAELVIYIASGVTPEELGKLNNNLNVFHLRQWNVLYYSRFVLTPILLSLMKSYVWFLVIKILRKIKLLNPFTKEVAHKLERISYILFGIWIAGVVADAFSSWLFEIPGWHNGNSGTGAFLFMGGLVFIISQIFRRGVEIQSENDLTV